LPQEQRKLALLGVPAVEDGGVFDIEGLQALIGRFSQTRREKVWPSASSMSAFKCTRSRLAKVIGSGKV
jgi:hypothetical protein